MKLQRTKLGFTLIELLVVITIIGILATGAVSVYTSQIQKARDSTRITDVNSLRSGIEQYYQDSSVYPNGADDFIGSGNISIQSYLPNLAEDPKHNQTCNGSRCGYVYAVGPDTVGIVDGSYEVSTGFENQGNINLKANSTSDNGDDDSRLEIGTLVTTTAATDLNTVSDQNTGFAGSAANNTTNPLVILKSNVVTK